MIDVTYNGWKNYETWAVGMFLDGNYTGAYDYYETIERVRNTIAGYEPDQFSTENVPQQVAYALQEWVEENVSPHSVDDDHPDPQLHPLVSDLLSAALSSVDWYELADCWIENVREQVAS